MHVSRSIPQLVGIATILAALACAPESDTNASNPTASPPLRNLYASEPHAAYFPSRGRTFLAYIDEAGAYQFDEGTQTLKPIVPGYRPVGNQLVWIGQTYAGLSYSDNGGLTWVRLGPIQPAAPNCATPPCATFVGSDPWLAASPTTVLYSLLASWVPSGVATPSDVRNAVAVVRSNGDISFSEPRIAALETGGLDKPSISMAGNTAAITYLDALKNVRIVSSNAWSNFESWSLPTTLNLPRIVPDSGFQNPIVRLVDATHGYVSVIRPAPFTPGQFDIIVVQIVFSTVNFQWFVLRQVFFSGANEISTTVVGGAPGAPRPWRDEIPVGFDVGGNSERHLFVAWRANGDNGATVSTIRVADCDDVSFHECFATPFLSPAWRSRKFLAGESRFQPQVAASHYSSDVAVTWLNQVVPGSVEVFFNGIRSFDEGFSWTNPVAFPDMPAFRPCPTPYTDSSGAHFFGDYTASVVLAPPFVNAQGRARVVSARADSRGGCLTFSTDWRVTFDQHVEALAW